MTKALIFYIYFFNVALLQFQHEQLFYSYCFYNNYCKRQENWSHFLDSNLYLLVHFAIQRLNVFLCNKCFFFRFCTYFSRFHVCIFVYFVSFVKRAELHFLKVTGGVQLISWCHVYRSLKSCEKQLQSFHQNNKCRHLN